MNGEPPLPSLPDAPTTDGRCETVAGSCLSGWQQPFVQWDEDVSNLMSRVVNLTCIVIGLLLEAGLCPQMWAQVRAERR